MLSGTRIYDPRKSPHLQENNERNKEDLWVLLQNIFYSMITNILFYQICCTENRFLSNATGWRFFAAKATLILLSDTILSKSVISFIICSRNRCVIWNAFYHQIKKCQICNEKMAKVCFLCRLILIVAQTKCDHFM